MNQLLDGIAIILYSISTIFFLLRFLSQTNTRKPAFLFLGLGLVTHGIDLLVLTFEQHRFPALNFIQAFCSLTFATLFLLLVLRKKIMETSAVVLLPIAILSIILQILYPAPAEKLEPVLKAGWIYIHIPLMILSVACLAISFITAIMYLLQEKQLKSKRSSFLLERLPSLEAAEEISYKSLWIGFFLLTLGMVTGMIWSKYLRGRYWSWDYKEIWAMVTWALYAVLLHGRMLSAWRGRKAAYLAILGFVLILFTFAGVSLIFKVYHSF
jgi:cytochrome c-type biogenesis protein CcsB